MDIGRGVGRAQGCPLRDRAERPHCEGPQVEVAVMTGDYELGVAGARGRVL